jgi:hypothetical protein
VPWHLPQEFVATPEGAAVASALQELHERRYPDYCAELAGLADAAHLDYQQV